MPIPVCVWSAAQCALSIFTWHNETLNIHSHLLPALYFSTSAAAAAAELLLPSVSAPHGTISSAAADIARTPQQQITQWSSLLFLVAGSVVHANSATYHCFGARSATTARHLLRFDLGGIGFFMLACMFNGVLVGFSCVPLLQQCYLAIMCCIGGAALLAPFIGELSHGGWHD